MEPTVLTIGTFDAVHAGHLNLLRRCSEYGKVVVGVNTDEFVERYKGKPPLFSYAERAKLISLFGYRVNRNDSAGKELIDKVNPDILVIGSDWAKKDYYSQIGVDQDYLDKQDIQMLYIPYTRYISTSEIVRRARAS